MGAFLAAAGVVRAPVLAKRRHSPSSSESESDDGAASSSSGSSSNDSDRVPPVEACFSDKSSSSAVDVPQRADVRLPHLSSAVRRPSVTLKVASRMGLSFSQAVKLELERRRVGTDVRVQTCVLTLTSDPSLQEDDVNLHQPGYRERYYRRKMGFDPDQPDGAAQLQQCGRTENTKERRRSDTPSTGWLPRTCRVCPG
jgi:hypothetical protein